MRFIFIRFYKVKIKLILNVLSFQILPHPFSHHEQASTSDFSGFNACHSSCPFDKHPKRMTAAQAANLTSEVSCGVAIN